MKIRASVVRPDFVKATVLLIDGREITIDCNGLLARCLQHECDHLNGILLWSAFLPHRRLPCATN